MWIIMTSSAHMPTSVKAAYRNIALVKLTPEYAAEDRRPLMISDRAKGVERIRHWGHYHVGKTPRGAYQQALVEAEAKAAELNKAREEAA